MAPRDENQPDENEFNRRPRVNQIEEIPDEIPEWVKVSFLKFMVLLIIWGFFYNSCKFLCQTACGLQFQKIPKNSSKLFFDTLAKSFYYVNHGSSIIASKVSQIISLMKT